MQERINEADYASGNDSEKQEEFKNKKKLRKIGFKRKWQILKRGKGEPHTHNRSP